MRIRDLARARMRKLSESKNDNRSLLDSILHDELRTAIERWIANAPNTGVLIGGLAVSYWARPRGTSDIDVLFPDENWPREVKGFKKIRDHAMQDRYSHAEVKIVNPEVTNGNLSKPLVDRIISSATIDSGMQIASVGGLIASKLARATLQDKADIDALLKAYPQADMDAWRDVIGDQQWSILEEIKADS